jgi:hypothetical protein
MESKILNLEKKFKRPNTRYVKLASGEYVLLELEFSDGTFMATPEYSKYVSWPYKDEATIEDKWETELVPYLGGSDVFYDPSKPEDMLNIENIANYNNGKWQLKKGMCFNKNVKS